MAGVEFCPPQFTLSLKSQEAEEGGVARFEAVVSGFPIPAVKWFHNGNDVTNSINYEISSDATGRCVLLIPEVFDEDAGVFTCCAENGAGEADTSAELVVQTNAVAPDFIQHLSSLSAAQGETVRFEVKTTGLPAPRVKWYREGAEIRNSDDFRIASDGVFHSLTITEAYEEDTGRFTVTATNYIGKATSTAMLTVSGEGSVTSSRDSDFITGSPMPTVATAVHTMDDSSQAVRGRVQTSSAVSDADFVQKSPAPKQPPSVLPKTRKQSPSPIRSVRMSPPRIRSATSQQSPLPRRQIRSVKPPSPSPTRSAPPAATVAGKPEGQAKGESKVMQRSNFMNHNTQSYSSSHQTKTVVKEIRKKTVQVLENSASSAISYQSSEEHGHGERKEEQIKHSEFIATSSSNLHEDVQVSEVRQSHLEQQQLSEERMEISTEQEAMQVQEVHGNMITSSDMSSAVSCAVSSSQKSSFSTSANAPVPASRPPKVAPAPILPSLPPSLDYCLDPDRQIPGVKSVKPSSVTRKRPLPMVTSPQVEYPGAAIGASSATSSLSHTVESQISSSFNEHVSIETSAASEETGEETAVYPPFFKVPIKNTTVTEGEMSQFECHIYGNPTPNLKWYREGALIESSQDFLISFDGKIGTLLIRETYIDDAGMFTCSAQNKAGSTSCSALLTVNVPETEDEATIPAYKSSDFVRSMSETDMSMTDYEGFESTELDFVSGVSEAELTDTEFVKPSVSAHHQPDSSEQVVGATAMNVLSPVAEENLSTPSGKLSSRSPHMPTAIAAESITPDQQVITGGPPKIERSPESVVKIVEGDSVRFSFVISGSPPPKVTWEKNGVAIQKGYRFKLEENLSKHSFSLTIGMLLLEDAGQYTLTATNRFGFVHGSVSLVTEAQYKSRFARGEVDMQSNLQVQAADISSVQPSLSVSSPTRGRGERRTPTDRMPGIRVSSLSPGSALQFKDFDDRRSVSPSRRLDDVDTLDIEKYFKPKFLVKPLSKECNEGGATRLDCKISGRPSPEVMWYHKGVLMHEDYSHRVVVKEDGVRSLIISPATPRDGGEYTVVAHNKAGKAVSSVTITVIPKEGTERPHILEKPQSVIVNEGEMVRLEVFAVGRPTPEIVWLKDNSILIPDKNPDIRIEGVDGHGLLTIPIISKRLHDAWYTATAVNKVGRDLTRCKVKVQYRDIELEPEKKLYIPKSARRLTPVAPSLDRIETRKIDNFDETDLYDESRLQKPRVKKKLVSVKQKLLGSAHFECHVVPIGDPNMKVEWFHDGKPIEFANRIMTTFEFGYCSLDITAVYPRDSGVISCRATNLHGQVQSSCTLVVKDTKGLVEATQLPENRQLESIQQRDKEFRGVGDRSAPGRFDDEEEPHAPQIVLDIDPAQVKEGEPARFRCRITGYPLPKVEWFLNGQSIRKSKRFRLWCDGIHYFEIATVRGYDTGEVRMVANNSQGQVEGRATLEVYQAEDLRSVLHRAEKVPTTEKGDVELTVKRYRTSRSIEDQMREENARKMVSSLKTVEKPTLTGQKKPMKKETEKELTAKFGQLTEEEHVKAAFKVGKKLVEVDLDMEAPIILERVQSLTVPKGSDAKFMVRFHGKPGPEVVWCWNGKPMDQSDRISWYMTSESTSELIMRSLTKDDSGGISARVFNPAGEAGSQGFLLVQKPNILKFVEPLQNVSAKENDRSAIFECMLSERYINVEWRHSDALGNETVLCGGDKYQMNVEGATCYLRISNINMKDGGSYHCIVVGQDDKRTTADLLVEAVPKKITTGLNNLTSREGYQGRFETIVSHEGVSGTWTKNGTPIQSDGKYEIHDVGLKRRLQINDLTPEDEGTYEYIYNGDSSAANLTVTEIPVNILQTLSDQTIFAGKTVTFQVKLSMEGARYNWYKDGEPVKPSERITISSEFRMYTLVIDTCLAADAGQYSFRVGSNESSAKLTVKDIYITEKLNKESALESHIVKFECEVNERDYKDGLWLCNEKLIAQDKLHVIETNGTTQSLTLTSASLQDAGLYVYVTGSGTGTEALLDVIPVTITRHLHDVKGSETKTVKLELEVSHPDVKGTWWKDGKQIEGSKKYELGSLGKVRYLKIHTLAVDDQATYIYKAGSQSSSAHVTVKGATITQPLHDASVLESTDVTLECEVTGEGGEGVWTQNGVVLDFSSPDCADEYVVTGLKHRLTLRNVQQDHAGTYQFQYGSAKTSADISVEGVKLSKALRNIHVADASDAVFAVEVAQDGISNIRWERNGVELKPDSSKYIMTSEDRTFTLTVREVSHVDVAAYSFVAGSAKSSGRIYVEDIEFIRELQDSHVMEKRTAEFVAEVDNENVSGYWTKDGVTLRPSEKHQIQSERKVHRLIISNTSSEDSGFYKLHIGRANTSGRLTVETVHIKRKMKDASIKETQSGVFECEVSHPDITSNMYLWMKNGVEIHASESVSITVEGYTHRLKISNCLVDDSGEYTFVAGKDRSSSKLDVQVVKVTRPLTSTRKVTAHETVVFETEVDSSDINVFWTKDGRRIDFSSTITDSSSKFEARSQYKTHTLKIKDVYAEDAGVYALFAGRELTSSTLYVEVISVDITKFIKTVSVVEKHEATLEFRVSKPNVKAQWFKQGIEIDISLPRYTYEIEDRTHKLHVNEVTFEDAGEYTFQAGNQKATTFLYIQPPEPPRFVQELRNCIVIAGEPARFTVRISGRPDPVVTWYKEGITITPSFKYKILHDEDQHTLVVVGVEESDAGEYVCEAKNDLGAMRTKAALEVDSKDKTPVAPPPEIKAPAIVEPIQNFITREGQSARFQCKVTGTEPKVTWFVNDKRIKPSRYFKISQYHGVHQLEITEAYPEDEGVYGVTVSNTQGEVSCSAKLQLDSEFSTSLVDIATDDGHVSASHQITNEPVTQTSAEISVTQMSQKSQSTFESAREKIESLETVTEVTEISGVAGIVENYVVQSSETATSEQTSESVIVGSTNRKTVTNISDVKVDVIQDTVCEQTEIIYSKVENGFIAIPVMEEILNEVNGSSKEVEQPSGDSQEQVARSDVAVVICDKFRSKFLCDVERTLGLHWVDFSV